MCPKAAYGIEKLTLRISHQFDWGHKEVYIGNAYRHLQQLISNAFLTSETNHQCRRRQLDNVSSIAVQLPVGIPMREQHLLVMNQLLAQFKNIQKLYSVNNTSLMFAVNAPQLQQMLYQHPVTPAELHLLAQKHPSLHRLEFGIAGGFSSRESYKQALGCFTTVRRLAVAGENRTLDLQLFTDMTQLDSLSLQRVVVRDRFRLTNPQPKHLSLDRVRFHLNHSRLRAQQRLGWQPVQWPALRYVEYSLGSTGVVTLTESDARVFLPLPHPGFTVCWPKSLLYDIDIPSHPEYGFLGLRHMRSVHILRVRGQHIGAALKAALKAVIESQVIVSNVIACDGHPNFPVTMLPPILLSHMQFKCSFMVVLQAQQNCSVRYSDSARCCKG